MNVQLDSLTPANMKPTVPELSLKVPYYVYENDELHWKNYTFLQVSSEDRNYSDFKHSDDFWLAQAALRHPQRTRNPKEAQLFFVPVLLNAVAERRLCIDVYWSFKCFKRPGEAYRFVDKKLSDSPYFQTSQGSNHVVVISHWLDPPRRIPNLLRCNLINFEGYLPMPSSAPIINNNTTVNDDNGKVGSFLPNFYVGTSCEKKQSTTTSTGVHDAIRAIQKDFDFAMVAKIVDGNPDFESRRKICQWLHEAKHSVSRCGPGPQCPALAQARYGFHPRGDTWGSNRVLDTVLARTVPLFTDARQYDLLPPFVPWRELSYLVNVTDRQVFLQDLQRILSKPKADYDAKRKVIDQYQYLFDHTQIYQFDAYMATFAQRLGLQ